MRKLFIYLSVIGVLLVSCSNDYDDSALWDSVNGLENRVAKLEELCKQMNTNISSLQEIVKALKERESITNVSTLSDGSGYSITFTSGKTITIYHGKNGSDGSDGTNGVTPTISVKQDADGIYYWTVNGNWLIVDGKKVKAIGTDGANGSDGNDGSDGTNGKDGITPKFKIDGGYWYISYDNEQSWNQLGKATGDSGLNGEDGNALFKGVSIANGFVVFTLNDEESTEIRIPIARSFDIIFEQFENVGISPNKTLIITYHLQGGGTGSYLKAIAPSDWNVSIIPISETEGQIAITAPDIIADTEIIILISDGADKTLMRTISCVQSIISISENQYYASADGEVIEIPISSNTLYDIIIEETAKKWVSYVSTRSMKTDFHSFKISKNETGLSRQTIITIKSKDEFLTEEITIKQLGNTNLTIDLPSGGLLSKFSLEELACVETLKITGLLSDDDFDVIANSMANLHYLDLSEIQMTTFPQGAFANTTNLRTVILPTNMAIIPNNLFTNSAIESVTFPSSLTTIGDFAFADCIQLTSAIVIPDNVISIGIAAFQNCSQIAKELTIGLKVRKINELAFCNCNVEKIMFRAIFCTIATNAFEGNFITNIVTPVGSTIAYEVYEMFKDIPIEERYDLIEERVPVEWNFKKSTTGEATEGHFLARINHSSKTFRAYGPPSYGIYVQNYNANQYWIFTVPLNNWGKYKIQYTHSGNASTPISWITEYSSDNVSWNTLGTVYSIYYTGSSNYQQRILTLLDKIETLYIRVRAVSAGSMGAVTGLVTSVSIQKID